VTDTPLVAGSLFGLRTWRVAAADGDEALVGPLYDAPWPAGGKWLRASCPGGHVAPDPQCECGVHAWHPRLESAREVMAVRRVVPGVLEAQGPVEVHEDGFRAQRARPYALVAIPGRNAELVRRLADRYGVAVIDATRPEELLAYCHQHRLGMDERVVAELLGIGDPGERRRAKLRKARIDVLRVAAAVVISVLLVALGLAVTTDPPAGSTLYGRTGQVQVH
jgi:hypothetical protein